MDPIKNNYKIKINKMLNFMNFDQSLEQVIKEENLVLAGHQRLVQILQRHFSISQQN